MSAARPAEHKGNWPPGFWHTFRSERVTVGEVGLHVVQGGSGPPLVLIAGWPQTWYAWRNAMPALAEGRTVIAVEPRGFGASDKPAGPYDLGTVAAELVALMDRIGHAGPFSLAGHDVGAWIGYALAADFPGRVKRLALIDAAIPGVSPPPSALAPPAVNRRVWHFGFNRLDADLNEALVRGREEVLLSWHFRNKAARQLSAEDIAVYVEAYRDPDTLRAGFDYYRAIDANLVRNAQRAAKKLAMPILLVAGEQGVGGAMIEGLSAIGTEMSHRILPGVGHYVPDEAPEELARILAAFFGENG